VPSLGEERMSGQSLDHCHGGLLGSSPGRQVAAELCGLPGSPAPSPLRAVAELPPAHQAAGCPGSRCFAYTRPGRCSPLLGFSLDGDQEPGERPVAAEGQWLVPVGGSWSLSHRAQQVQIYGGRARQSWKVAVHHRRVRRSQGRWMRQEPCRGHWCLIACPHPSSTPACCVTLGQLPTISVPQYTWHGDAC
jgi:hypothetical protein